MLAQQSWPQGDPNSGQYAPQSQPDYGQPQPYAQQPAYAPSQYPDAAQPYPQQGNGPNQTPQQSAQQQLNTEQHERAPKGFSEPKASRHSGGGQPSGGHGARHRR